MELNGNLRIEWEFGGSCWEVEKEWGFGTEVENLLLSEIWDSSVLMHIIFPRFFLAEEQRRHFEKLSIYCNHYASLIPMSFVLGISTDFFTFTYTLKRFLVNIIGVVFPPIHVVNPCRFLCDRDSEPLVESVHIDPAAGPGDVRALGRCTGRGRARKNAATHTRALHQSVCSAHPALSQHRRLQTLSHHGSCGGGG